jgi:hypothetical protein
VCRCSSVCVRLDVVGCEVGCGRALAAVQVAASALAAWVGEPCCPADLGPLAAVGGRVVPPLMGRAARAGSGQDPAVQAVSGQSHGLALARGSGHCHPLEACSQSKQIHAPLLIRQRIRRLPHSVQQVTQRASGLIGSSIRSDSSEALACRRTVRQRLDQSRNDGRSGWTS